MIIGLGYAAQVGKDSTGDILVEAYNFKRLGFADKLKEVALAINPLINTTHRLAEVVHAAGWEATKRLFPESRVFLQHLGSVIRDQVDPMWLISPVIQEIYAAPNHNYVITDVRYRNEIDALSAFDDAFFVNVTRPGYGPLGTHQSEWELADYKFNYVLENSGTLEDLVTTVDRMMVELR